MHCLVGKGIQHSSGRVIALGRLLLATLFLIAIEVDYSQPTHAPDATFALLIAECSMSNVGAGFHGSVKSSM